MVRARGTPLLHQSRVDPTLTLSVLIAGEPEISERGRGEVSAPRPAKREPNRSAGEGTATVSNGRPLTLPSPYGRGFPALHRLLWRPSAYNPLTRCPPSTATTAPVMWRPASEQSNISGPSRSAGSPMRRLGMRLVSASPASLAKKSRLMSVTM